MTIELTELYKILDTKYYYAEVILASIITAIFILLAISYFIQIRIEKKIISELQLSQNKLDEKLKKYEKNLDIAFLNEPIRTNIVSELASKSIRIKLDIYEEFYQYYFKFYTNFKAEMQESEKYELLKGLVCLKEKIFINNIYLGKEIVELLIEANIKMILYANDPSLSLKETVSTGNSSILSWAPPSDSSGFEEIEKVQKIIIETLEPEHNLGKLTFFSTKDMQNSKESILDK